MATGGVSVDTSDGIFDNVCSMCKERNKTVDAAKYCVDCHDYYCSECVNIHTTVPALKGHKLMERDVDQSGKLPMVPTERCERHSFKAVDMYCQNHNVVGCYTCMAVDHRTCQDVFYIPEYVKTNPNVVPEFLQRLLNTETKLRDLLKTFNREGTDLQTNKLSEIQKVKTYTKQLEERIKEAEKDAISEIEEKYKELNEDTHKHIDDIQKELENVGSTRANIDSVIQNESQAFVTMLFNENKVSSAENTGRDAENIKLGRRIKFLLDPKNESLMTRKLCLGRTLPYNFVYKGEFSIKISSDSKPCDIYGTCILSDKSIMFADRNNKTLKLINTVDLKVVDYYILSSEPWEVCCMDGNKSAVCLPNEKTVQVFKVNRKMSLQKSICLKFSCQGISYFDGQFYITDYTCVYICSNEGTALKTISKDSANNLMFNSIFNVFVSEYNNVLFLNEIGEENKGVISIDGNGNILNVVSAQIRWPHGLTAADNGKVFACGYLSKNVILLDENGEFEDTVITEHLTGPQALCFNSRTGILYVPNYKKDSVQLFELK